MVKQIHYLGLIGFIAGWLTVSQVFITNQTDLLYSRWLGVSFMITSFINIVFLVALILVFRKRIPYEERLYWPLTITLTGWLDNLISYTRFSGIPDYWPLPGGIVTNASDLLIWVGLIWLFGVLFIWRKPA